MHDAVGSFEAPFDLLSTILRPCLQPTLFVKENPKPYGTLTLIRVGHLVDPFRSFPTCERVHTNCIFPLTHRNPSIFAVQLDFFLPCMDSLDFFVNLLIGLTLRKFIPLLCHNISGSRLSRKSRDQNCVGRETGGSGGLGVASIIDCGMWRRGATAQTAWACLE